MAVLSRCVALSVFALAGVALLAGQPVRAQGEENAEADEYGEDEYGEEEVAGEAGDAESQSRFSQGGQPQPTEEQMRQQQELQRQMIGYIRNKGSESCVAQLDARMQASQESGEEPASISDECNEEFGKLAGEFREVLQ